MTRPRVLIGLIGANIMGSLSPALFAGAFAAAGIDGFYHLIDVDRLPGRRLPQLLDALKAAGFAGANITYPFKQDVMALLDAVDPEAAQTGAINTVAIAPDGRATGYNFDRRGWRHGFEEIFGRDGARATTLKNDLAKYYGASRCRVTSDLAADIAAADGVVNATQVGMRGFPGNPVPVSALSATHWCADVVYTPIETEFIRAAAAKGCRVMTGAGMCVHQAVEAFRLFTGVEPDLARLHRAFATALAARDSGGCR